MARRNMVTIRLDDSEKARARGFATQAGVSLSEMFRRLLIDRITAEDENEWMEKERDGRQDGLRDLRAQDTGHTVR